MKIKSILAGAAIALALGIGTASAGEKFTTLDGVTAFAMSSSEMDAVVGRTVHFAVEPPFTTVDGPFEGEGGFRAGATSPGGIGGIAIAGSCGGAVTADCQRKFPTQKLPANSGHWSKSAVALETKQGVRMRLPGSCSQKPTV